MKNLYKIEINWNGRVEKYYKKASCSYIAFRLACISLADSIGYNRKFVKNCVIHNMDYKVHLVVGKKEIPLGGFV
jgi:hypothetical protein